MQTILCTHKLIASIFQLQFAESLVHVPEEGHLGVPAGVAGLAVHAATHNPHQGVPLL